MSHLSPGKRKSWIYSNAIRKNEMYDNAQEIDANLSSCQNNLAGNKNQQHDFWLLYSIDQASEELSLDCVHRIPLPSPSPITVAPIGATVDRYPLHRIPLPPPLPSRFLLSPAKWMGTLPCSPPPRPVASQRSARDRNTPSSDLQAIQPRPQRRRRR
jgi:hypothetical protein